MRKSVVLVLLIALGLSAIALFSAQASALQITENQCNVTARASEVIELNYPFQQASLELISSDKTGATPCYFRAGEEASAVVERAVYRCAAGARCPGAVVELRKGDVVNGLLAKRGEEQNPTNYLLDWKIVVPACEPILCDLACQNGFAKDWRGCDTCACSETPTEEKTFTVNVFEGWNFFSVPLSQERTLCPPGAYCIQVLRPSPRVIASTCNASARIWSWNPLAKTYGELQLPDVSAREGLSFIELAKGYWLKSPKNCAVTFLGKSFSLNDLGGAQLEKGWNAVGAPSEAVAFDDVKGNCVVEKGPFAWSAGDGKYVSAQLLEPGKAYFVKVANGCVLGEKEKAGEAEDYCENDSDCVRQDSCCDCGTGKYVNKKHYAPAACETRCMCAVRESKGACIQNHCVGAAVSVSVSAEPTGAAAEAGNTTCGADSDCFQNNGACCSSGGTCSVVSFLCAAGFTQQFRGCYCDNGQCMVNASCVAG